MGWGFPVEEYNYVMIEDPSIAPNNGTCYSVEWTRLNGTGPQIQAVAAGTLDGGTFGGLSTPVAIEQGVELVITSALFVEAEGFNTTWVAGSEFDLENASGFKVGGMAGSCRATAWLRAEPCGDRGAGRSSSRRSARPMLGRARHVQPTLPTTRGLDHSGRVPLGR